MGFRRSGWTLAELCLAWMLMVGAVVTMGTVGYAQTTPAIPTTTVSDTVYEANGTAATGTVLISWPSFTTWAGDSVQAGSTSVTIGAGGSLSVPLVANAGATPMGSYYTVVYHLGDGSETREYWVVPVSTGTVAVSTIRSSVLPASVAMQTVSKSYVDTAIASAIAGTPLDSATQPYVLKAGDTMTGPLVLPADPTAPLQASDKNYVDTQVAGLTGGLSQKVSLLPSGTQVVSQPAGSELAVNSLNGVEYASQYATGAGNNGIANATTGAVCPAGCDVVAESTYPQVEGVAPTAWSNATHVEDRRGGAVAESFFNPLPVLKDGDNAGKTINVTSTQSAQSVLAATGSSQIFSTGLEINSQALAGGSNVFPKLIQGTVPYFKTTFSGMTMTGTNNTLGQHNLLNLAQNCYGVGDCLMGSEFMLASGGFRDDSDEGSHPFDRQFSEDTRVFTGNCTSGCSTGSTLVQIAATANGGTQGEGRYLIDTNPALAITTGSIIGGTSFTGRQPAATFAGTSFPVSTFLETAQTIPTQANSINPGTVTVPIATSAVPSGFATNTAALPASSGVACVSDVQVYDNRPLNFETAAYRVIDASHLQMTLYRPHASGATIAVGGLCGYGLEQKVDTTNGIRQVFPVIGSTSATTLLYAGGYSALVGIQGQTSAYVNASLVIASIARTSNVVTVTTTSNLPADLNALTLSVQGVGDSSYNGSFAVTTTGPNTLTYASVGPDSTSSGGTLTYVTGSYGLYPMAEVQGVYNATTKAVDGQMMLAANTVPWATGDPVEEPHYFQELVQDDTDFITQYTPRAVQLGGPGVTYRGNNGYGLYGWQISNADPASSYFGNGGTHTAPSIGLNLAGVWNHSMEMEAGESTVFDVHCNSHGCGKWNSTYDLFDLDSSTGTDREVYSPQTSTLTYYFGGTGYSFSPTGLTAGNLNVTTLNAGTVHGLFTGTVSASSLPVFQGSGAAHAIGAVPDPGAVAGTTRFLREDGLWAPAGGSSGYAGTWASGTSYTAGSFVSYSDGNSYVSLVNANTGNVPPSSPSDWAVFAAKGSAGAAGANGVASLPQLVSVLEKYPSVSPNLLILATAQSGYIFPNGNLITPYNGLTATDYIPCNAGGTMTVNEALPALGGDNTWSAYDQNFNYLTGSTAAVAANTPIAMATTCAFVRFTLSTSTLAATMIVNGSTFPASYVTGTTYTSNQIDTKIASAVNAGAGAGPESTFLTLPLGTNFFDKNRVTMNALLETSSGTLGQVDTGMTGYYVSGLIPVQGGQTYTMAAAFAAGNPLYGLVWYDVNQNPISSVSVPFTAGENFVAPSNAFFVRFPGGTTVNANLTAQMWQQGTTATAYQAFPQLPTSTTARVAASSLNGVNVAVWGDSYSAAFSNIWQNQFAALTGANLVFQDARAGRDYSPAQFFECYGGTATGTNATVASGPGAGYHNTGTTGNTLAQDFAAANVQLLIIYLGTNNTAMGGNPGDAAGDLGQLSDAASSATFFGYVRNALTGLFTEVPNLKVLLVGPNFNNEGPVQDVEAIDEALQSEGTLFGVRAVNMNQGSGINSVNASVLLRDGLHPTDAVFQTVIAPIIANEAQRLF